MHAGNMLSLTEYDNLNSFKVLDTIQNLISALLNLSTVPVHEVKKWQLVYVEQ